MSASALLVIAKAPVAGRVKTRLCPPCSPRQAAALAEAALRDTLEAALAAPASRHVLVLDGEAPAWLPASLEVVPQRGTALGERLTAAFADAAAGPALLVGMDTPQVTPALLAEGLERASDSDAVLGPAPDGGYWAVGLRDPSMPAFTGVPMSSSSTLYVQRRRLADLGLATTDLPALRDVDTMADARAVAAEAPASRFGRALIASGHAGDDQQAVPVAAT